MPTGTAGENAIKSFYDVVDQIGKAIEVINDKANSPTSRLIYGYVANMIERAESVVVLYDKGHQSSADIIIRNISETAVHIINAEKFGQKYIDRLRITTLDGARAKYNFALNNGMKLPLDIINNYKSKINDITAAIIKLEDSHGWTPKEKEKKSHGYKTKKRLAYVIKIVDAFQMAKLTNDYLEYMHLCQRVHADLHNINQDHLSRFDESGFIDIGKQLSPLELKVSLPFAAKMLVKGVTAALQHFGKDEKILEPAKRAQKQMESEFSKMQDS